MMPDKYSRFEDLATSEKEGVDYKIQVTDMASPVAIFAPHGGAIEPGTSEIAVAIAANGYSLYCFEGIIPGRPHRDLHITSDRFDEPRACRLVDSLDTVICIHGRSDGSDPDAVWMGGLDEVLRDAIGAALQKAGFLIAAAGHRLSGQNQNNICNRGRSKAGVQMEIPRSLRDRLVNDNSLRDAFAGAVRAAIAPQ